MKRVMERVAKVFAGALPLFVLLLLLGSLAACGASEGSVDEADTINYPDATDTDSGGETAGTCDDQDDDGYGDGAGCKGLDCNDNDALIFPGAQETCGDGVDQDCDGGDLSCGDCLDEDQDGYGEGDACLGKDCDDHDAARHPGAEEVCGNGKDEDCSGADLACPLNCTDQDGDTYGEGADCAGIDCNDGDAAVHPGAQEICGNGKDDDCMLGDEVCPSQCIDNDKDSYGEGPDCVGPDCNDFDPLIHPGANEVCGDSIDQDCDGDDLACPEECVDVDQDGFGVGATCEVADCNDTDATVYPGADETCGDGTDQDCNGSDLACGEDCVDEDGDGYGAGADCDGEDCNDSDPTVNAGADEICGNGKDDDCAGGDEECATKCVDADQDGFGVGDDCVGDQDCADNDAAVNPGATEVCGNGKDDDCDDVDDECPQQDCTTDADCGNEQVCDHADGECRYAKVWEWWAPTVYQDIDQDNPYRDMFCPINFDGDEIVLNNGQAKDDPNKPAIIYYSFVKTSTHWYLGYYMYYPHRWSDFGVLGTQYDNAMRGVLLVVEQDGSSYGKLIAMVTTREDTFMTYAPVSSIVANSYGLDGDVRFDESGHHPIVYAHAADHGLFGDAYLLNDVSNWEISGFPGDDGLVYRWGNVADIPENPIETVGSARYELLANKDFMWPGRFDTGGATYMFDEFGQWTSNDPHSRSLAPWRFNDVNTGARPAGEFLFDPADFVRTVFSGWGPFSYEYVYNPYAVRVDIDDLQLLEDTVSADPFGGDADPYFTLYMFDGAGHQYKALDIFYGLQNNWSATDVPFQAYPLNMHEQLGRYFFYGLDHPDYYLFGVDLKDDDGGFSPADWLMDPGETHYYDLTGEQLLNWGLSNAFFVIENP